MRGSGGVWGGKDSEDKGVRRRRERERMSVFGSKR